MELKITDKIIAGRAVLVGVDSFGMAEGECEISLAELRRLLDTAGGEEFARLVQNKDTPDPRTLIGKGKVEELSDLCKKVYVLQNLPFLTGEEKLQAEIAKKQNVEVICSCLVTDILGETAFEGLAISVNGEARTLSVDGTFVAIGQKPENEPFASVTTLNEYGYIVAGEDCLPQGAKKGVFVAGDCRTKGVRQVTTATADGATAALAACRLIDELK